jgi:hypothetical protein
LDERKNSFLPEEMSQRSSLVVPVATATPVVAVCKSTVGLKVMAVIFGVLMLVFLGLFIYYYQQYNNLNKKIVAFIANPGIPLSILDIFKQR